MSLKILIVDDDEGDIRLIEEALNALKTEFSILSASSGEDGVQKAKDDNPDVVLLDTNLTGIDGFEACKRIKEIENCKAKVIILTGRIDTVDAGKARKMGATDYCVKTADYKELVNVLKNVIGEAT